MSSSGKDDAAGDFGKSDPQENFERMTSLARGPKGETGSRGERGLSRVQGRAIVILFLIFAALGVGNLLWTAHEVNSAAAAQQAEQAVQRQQGVLLEEKLCSTLEPLTTLAKLKPPSGNPNDNPSRAYEQQLSAKLAPLAQLSSDLGCRP